MKKLLAEFKQFATRGNVVDLAVGVIIGGAFGKIVTSLVNDIIMPVIGFISGGINFTNLSFTLAPAKAGKDAVVLKYGMFIQNVIDFLIIAFCIFIFIKIINKLQRKKNQEPEETPAMTKSEALLQEICDILKEK
ncbi:MAG: large-conductance mechanosensitive channel protein MscL [Clostridiales bacterium]|nr:large-conductance mechanosensitive channel protein MscL [Clostridiales bacterium]